jgi:predicted alpha/beta superfamily hydrolase
MQEIKRYQIRGVPGEVVRSRFGDRTVDHWSPSGGSEHLLIAHDGQNIFDGTTSTHARQTWKMAQSAIGVAEELGLQPPTIIAIWHSSTAANPWGRAKDLAPQKFFTQDSYIDPRYRVPDPSFAPESDKYLHQIFNEIVPSIFGIHTPEKTAMVGSSMGGLATLYAAIEHPDQFQTALALSPHWILSDENFARAMVDALPLTHKIWMSRGDKGLDKEYPPLQSYVDSLMRERGFTNNFETKVYKRSGHNERSWAKYLQEPLRFWLKTGLAPQSGVR